MESYNLVKVVAAFLAGVVITLGGVLMYVRTNEMVHPQRVAHTSIAAENPSEAADSSSLVGQDSADASAQTPPMPSDDLPTLKPVPKFQPTPHPVPAKPVAKPVRQTNVHSRKAKKPDWQIAQNLHLAKAVVPVSPSATATLGANKPAPSESTPLAETPSGSAAPSDESAQAAQDEPASTASQDTSPPPSSEPQPAVPQESAPPPQVNPAPQPHTVRLPAGANVIVRLGETLSSDDNYTGDTFRAHLESPIIVDGFIIADKGSKVLGRVVNAQKAGRVEGISELTLALTEINTTDSQRVKIETSTWNKKGVKTTGEDAAKIAGGAALGAIIGAAAGGGKGAAIGAGAGGAAGAGVVLATRGKAATLPVETRITFRLANPVTITEKLNF
ncbi:MAG: hypothetical protein JOY62_04775 [Acidobacteriaceae bacterium]|nr:hypothetical protein [Acidobacteriaceae bacterium]MBV9779269.1 hypothetical protein [Acidobacteriaceae bacterium]